ncbi:hypothetical protein BPLS_P6386 [Bathymodiolus platifrons methanotrophic gill symbiont]|uniref:hypothetical protein n=1 Tax=unclassified Gammaproteobacteria TaxID=33811 RepID=UPI000B40FB22|nr:MULTISPECIES: hypothetical protein [unclassified Gammaproteobacteria]GFO77754.1 hypothetical protein BPLS_P6386 [Bathymodiolus platifrons methanotrophic gill symbiont]
MSIGKSGRIVIEIDPDLKKKLYSELTLQGLSLKDWFLMSTNNYLTSKNNITPSSKKDNSEE